MHRRVRLGREGSHATQPVPIATIRIQPKRAIRQMRYWRNEFHRYRRLFSAHNNIELVYETMIDGDRLSDAAEQSIRELFELVPSPMRSDLVKMNPHSLKQVVENYDELIQALQGTEFEQFLD